MNTPRRHFIRSLAALAATASPSLRAAPRPTRLLVGFPAGGGSDAIARQLAGPLAADLGTSVIVENRAGAGGQLAALALKAAAPDGATLLLSHDHTISILPLAVKDPGFDPARDFVAVAGIATFANAFALSADIAPRTLPDYLRWIRDRGSAGSVGVPAPASVPEFLVRAIARRERVDLVAVPYRGSAPLVADLLGRQILAGIASVPDLIEQHRAGTIRIVAVMGGARQPVLPDVPTFSQCGLPGFEELPYYGVFAPAGTPRDTIKAIAIALSRALSMPDVRDRLTAMGLDVAFVPGERLAERERAYRAAWSATLAGSLRQ